MKQLKKAVIRTILVFATLHILILIYLAITTSNLTFLNIFSILDLNEFYPGVEKGSGSMIVSTVVIGVIFLINYKRR